MMYRDTYRIVTSVSQYVSYREVSVSLQAYPSMGPTANFQITIFHDKSAIPFDFWDSLK